MKIARPYPGLHKSPKKRPDGTVRAYYYAWKGGPPIRAEYGTPEFARQYREAVAARAPRADTKTLNHLIDSYLASRGKRKGRSGAGFGDLAPRTQADYRRLIETHVRPEFGDLPIEALKVKRVRQTFLDWRDTIIERIGERQGEYAFVVLQRVLSFAADRGMIDANPVAKAGRVYQGSRAEIVWSIEDEAKAMEALPPNLAAALQLGIWTAQRPSDVLAMRWADYDGETIRVKQGKTGKRVPVPVAAPLMALLDAMPRIGETIVVGARGAPLTKAGFDKMFRTTIRAAGIETVAIGDTRGTAVTRLRNAGCTVPEICAITGHSSGDVNRILERHYAATDPELALRAIRKLEARFSSLPTRAPTSPNSREAIA